MKTLLAILVSIIPIVFCTPTTECFEFPKLMALIVGLLIVACIEPRWKSWNLDRIGLAMVGFLFSALLSTVFSIHAVTSLYGNSWSLQGLVTISAYTMLFFSVQATFSGEAEGFGLLKLLAIPVVANAIYATTQFYGFDPLKWKNELNSDGFLRPIGMIGQPTFLAAWLAMCFPVFVYALHKAKLASWQRALFAVLCLAIVFVSVLCQSRGGWLALAIGILTYTWLEHKTLPKRLRQVLLAPVGLLSFGVVAASIIVKYSEQLRGWPFTRILVERLHLLFTPDSARLEYPLTALRIWHQNPWLGSGTDTFQLAFEHARSAHYWAIEPTGAPHRAHNEFLNILATQGIVGAIVALWLSWTIYTAIRELRRSHVDTAFISMLTAVIVVFYTQNLSSFTTLPTGVLFITTVGLLSSCNKKLNIKRGQLTQH